MSFILLQKTVESAENLIHQNIIAHYVELALPYVITILELMGIIVIAWSAIHSFWWYIQNTFLKKSNNIMFHFSTGLATGLEFKMAAEILKTVIVREPEEILVLGAVILLRALLSVLIHFEMKHNKNDK